ncbi:hypothetical protein [Paracoccus sp. JM45]|uniref:hypothetical protein n=1 Tax=Paracoccus sp. JM45 TaxID=2283626 RepID=UPI001C728385|nr:hypothetical protein [Paracoccus sp. JM45]
MAGLFASLPPAFALPFDVLPVTEEDSRITVMAPSPPLAWHLDLPDDVIVKTDDPAVPEAEEILTDTPNVFAWSRAQSGNIGGWTYRLFPDGSAIVLADNNRASGEYMLRCTLAESCEISSEAGVIMTVPAIGAPKPDLPADITGLLLAEYLAKWVLAGSGTPPEPPPAPLAPAISEPDVQPAPEERQPEPDIPPEDAESLPAQADTVAFLSGDIDCAEPDPYYPDACTLLPNPPAPAIVTPLKDNPARVRQEISPAQPATPAPKEPAEPKTLAERFRLSCSITTGAGLQYVDHTNQDTKYGKLRVSLGCSARLNDRLSMNMALVHFPLSGQQAPWDPDFTYSFNYKATDNLSISYSSYSARFSSEGANIVSSLFDGSFRGSYKLPAISLPMDKSAACSIGFGLPNPTNESFSLGCSVALTEKLRVGLTTYLYPPDVQESWNPDYTYTASYRVNDKIQLNYSNYSSSRWPWNRGSSPGPGVLGGSVSMSYKLVF